MFPTTDTQPNPVPATSTMGYTGLSRERAAGAPTDISQRRRNCDLLSDEAAAWILVSMSRASTFDRDSGIVPNDPTLAATGLPGSVATGDSNTTGNPGNSIIDSSDDDTDSQATVDLLMETGQAAGNKKSTGDKMPAQRPQPAKRKQKSAAGEHTAKKTKPSSSSKDQRRSILDDPALVSRSQEIDKEIGFPDGPSKENADEWLNKKTGYIYQQARERNEPWAQLEAAKEFVADMSKGVPPDSNEIPPHLFDFPPEKPPTKRTRAQMGQKARDKAFSTAKKDQSVAAAQGNNDAGGPESTEGPEPPLDEEFAQSNPKRQKTAKGRLANELDSNLGQAWDFKEFTSRDRSSKPVG